ncbi:MAG: ASCH domain-containing protein [Nitrobacter sp.]|uniref:ASCH domain-containing protein n=1 Tax=Nitrobacter sp. TaxID=29420 RepID=UPI0026116738|nr:ASCH domain-containing protein [Nitrobacter sp.]MCV0384877.1 ASCH domain-containing protein [Nitrobacter sp.]
MKAISIRQPWAWAILHAGKDIENRDRRWNLRGRIVVHASATMTRDEIAAIEDMSPHWPVPSREAFRACGLLGALVGTVEVVDCVRDHSSRWFFGPFGLVLREPRPFKTPVPYKGALGVMDVPDGILPPD